MMLRGNKIGVFDSGYGGLTILKCLLDEIPDYHFVYLGDNARAPYGNRSFELIYEYTLEALKFLFSMDCELVIIACNTASAKALRTIQQRDLPLIAPNKRVLGVIRPSAEEIGALTQTNVVGILGTEGTVNSESYPMELSKLCPHVHVEQWACPLWVPLIESNQQESQEGIGIIERDIQCLLSKNKSMDTIILACTHYPILLETIQNKLGPNIQVMAQGPLVAQKLKDYLSRHPEINEGLLKTRKETFYTTENSDTFNLHASKIYGQPIESTHIQLH